MWVKAAVTHLLFYVDEQLKSDALELTLSCLCFGCMVGVAILESVAGPNAGGSTLSHVAHQRNYF
jgi:hypothetical protein